MSKRSKAVAAKRQKREQQWVIGAVVAAIVVTVGIVAFSMMGNANVPVTDANGEPVAVVSGVIDPATYLQDYAESDHVLLDVRTLGEFESGHISGALNIPVEELAQRIAEVPTDKTVVVYCRSGNRSAQALRILTRAGYTPVYDLGGIIQWQAAGLPVE